jgi:hypothetical protein
VKPTGLFIMTTTGKYLPGGWINCGLPIPVRQKKERSYTQHEEISQTLGSVKEPNTKTHCTIPDILE